MFDAEGPSYVELCTPRAVVDEAAYTLANPTAAGLVRFSNEWPGVRTRVSDIGERTVTVERPGAFFADDGIMPAQVELRLELPEVLIQMFGVKRRGRGSPTR